MYLLVYFSFKKQNSCITVNLSINFGLLTMPALYDKNIIVWQLSYTLTYNLEEKLNTFRKSLVLQETGGFAQIILRSQKKNQTRYKCEKHESNSISTKLREFQITTWAINLW